MRSLKGILIVSLVFGGIVIIPEGEGPFPGIVMVHGSKNMTKNYYTDYSEFFSVNGIAVLNYDTRGYGDSEGNLWTSTFRDLGSDVVTASEFIRDLEFVDPDKTGLWADSHGGWISLFAEQLSGNIKFIISKGGS